MLHWSDYSCFFFGNPCHGASTIYRQVLAKPISKATRGVVERWRSLKVLILENGSLRCALVFQNEDLQAPPSLYDFCLFWGFYVAASEGTKDSVSIRMHSSG